MGVHKIINDFKDWCPQPPDYQRTKLKRYSLPIVAVLAGTLFFGFSFSLLSSQYTINQPVPQVPVINPPSNSSQPSPSPTPTLTPAAPWGQPVLPLAPFPIETFAPNTPSAIKKWRILYVDTGASSSLALDSSGYPHISYSGGGLKYAGLIGSEWSIQTVDSEGGGYSSLALDSNDTPHVSYVDSLDGSLKHALWNGMEWSIQTVDSTGDVGKYTSLALDSSGNPHITYYVKYNSASADLRYAWWNGTAWTIQLVDSAGNFGMFSSLALDSFGSPHIGYVDSENGKLKYAKWTGTMWSIQIVDYVLFDRYYSPSCSLALDSSDMPHISYYKRPSVNVSSTLNYASWIGTAWSIQTVDSVDMAGQGSSLALDSADNPHISYAGAANTDLKYAWWTGKEWIIITVDSAGIVGYDSSLALDAAGNPHISYYYLSLGKLKCASLREGN